jgi:hypothetical protein
MKTTNFTFIPNGSINRSYRKENHFYGEYQVMALNDDGTICRKISCRLYSTQAMNYCCVWISKAGETISGSGSAGGYGYNRMSAAVSEALKQCGYTFDKEIAGVGESAVVDALKAIAEYNEYINPVVIESHP